MNRITALFLAAALIAPCALAKSFKRGVGEDHFMLGCQLEALAPGVSWYYNWGTEPAAGYLDQVKDFTGFDFVPMCWNGNFNEEALRAYLDEHPEVKYILGFNEPNFSAQSNMTPAVAAQKWPAVQQIAADYNLQIVAPALNYSPNPPYSQPTAWMDEFVALVGNDAFDYVAIHNYGGFGVMVDLATEFHSRYGKPVWVTEFCYWPNEGDPNSSVAESAQISVMMQSVEWLEKTEWIERYAWFKPIGQYLVTGEQTGPRYGLLERQPNGQVDVSTLSQQGYVYVYMSTFEPDTYHAVNSVVSAADYQTQSAVILGSSSYNAERPIEIAQFTGGAYADYCFDVPEAGEYTLTLTVSGIGEPVRFNPAITILSVDGDGSEGAVLLPAQQFDLPGDDAVYTDKNFTLSLSAGRQTIRIKDAYVYMPSGIRIAALRLSDNAGIGNTVAASGPETGNVYNLAGVKLLDSVSEAQARASLPQGFYIFRNRKIIIK